MTRKMIAFLFAAAALLYAPLSPAQVTVPLWVKARYKIMPRTVAEHNLAGIEFTPYAADHWYKGNLHCHSNTDGELMPGHGDGPPEATLAWYVDHGYDFVAFTDHNYFHEGLVPPAGILYIPSEEITTMRFHVNGLGTTSYIRPLFGGRKLKAYQHAIDETAAQGGVAMLNHPITPLAYVYPNEFLRLHGLRLFEVYNMQPGSYDKLGEPLWDNVLTRGGVFWGTATDDAHMFASEVPEVGDPPGGGFVMVDAPELKQKAVLAALWEGKFYSSTGVLIERYEVTTEKISIQVAPGPAHTIEFIGARGEVLQREPGDNAEYYSKGDELYVRVRVSDENGKLALMQPVFYR